ncbi:DEAD/DEAH box helicase [Aliiglaciecola sp. LCG003]|uniref:DEAD/DEAH box helicase n=1 Tax=Aliiglaciecola sp. LCG003 TaxID=3053655 RepID=UPI00257325E8|nr:DEAD/DEAH box helicase [Aliiglaciecola sp. LCG003]WJG10689.1 DEAD/DEAH box helicase [Aliiglaciecola sp. LCG003]
MKFSSLGLNAEIEQAIKVCGYTEMTPVQEQTMVAARRGQDLLVNAQTGTGKTAAFSLPILQQMLDKPKQTVASSPRALILTPTRELAEQLAGAIGRYAQFTELKVTALYGGVKMGGQTNKLKAGIDILIATPGRLLEHMALNNLTLAAVEFVVLDEADRMLDMGFIADVSTIMQHTAKKRQTLLYSATTSSAVNELSHKILNNHKEIRVTKINATAETVNHIMYEVEESRKIELFTTLLNEQNWFQVLVFTSTKEQADKLMDSLKRSKIDAAVCHGDKSQGSRRRALADFKSAKLQVLIATEVAARGIDIQGLDHVVNFNLPYLPEDYVHRIGRTGRAGKSGEAISFVSREEERTVARIEKLIGTSIQRVIKKGFEVSNRVSLLKSISSNSRPSKSNKSSQTQITGDKVRNKKPTKPKARTTKRSTKRA